MKLELKHLAPYLPYGLQCIYTDTFGQLEKGYLTTLMTPDIISVDCCIDKDAKPILRPLKDVGTYIIDKEHNITFIESTGFYSESGIDFFIERVITGLVEMIIWQKLIEYHFDVFCLIEKGLAIDKNTLPK